MFNFSFKRAREDDFVSIHTVQEYSPNHAVEYLIEAEQEANAADDDDEQEELFEASNQLQEIIAEPVSSLTKEEQEFTYDATANDNSSFHNEEIAYQEAFANETHNNSSSDQLDNWLGSIKETLLSFPKLHRARAKKQINDLVSEFEINYLESIETESRS